MITYKFFKVENNYARLIVFYIGMKKLYFLANSISVVLVIIVNYYSQTGRINGQTVGSLSNEYANLFTPASFAFSIWGIIFLGLIGLVFFQGISLLRKAKNDDLFNRMGFVFALVNLGNSSWVIFWLYEQTFVSVLVMVGMLVGLLTLLSRMSDSSGRSFTQKLFVVGPINIYAGWIAVATIANFAAYLSKIGWDGGIFIETTWTMIMISIAVVANIYVTWTKSVKVFSIVGIWALYAIYVRHQSYYEAIAITALTGTVILSLSTLTKLILDRRRFAAVA